MPSKLPVLVLLLFASLLLAGTAHAVSASSAAVPLVLDEELEFEVEEEAETEEASACEEAEGEFAEGELRLDEVEEICEEASESKKKTGRSSVAPEECILRSAHAHAAVNDKSNKLKLTLGYTAYEPIGAKIEVGHIATFHRHLGRSGVLRIVEKLRKNPPKRLVVRIGVPSAREAGCPSRRLVLFPR